ncbi:OsmC family protein [Chloroflexales bacterium ZM16-3]|nr:OsmC family protein [Chloroflexales bacterium ZM16-3]
MPATWSLPEYLDRKRDLVDAYREQLRASDAAPAPLRASVTVAAGTGLRPVRIRDHMVVTDAGAALGGYGLGPSAPELLLGALASCLAHSAMVIAADRGVAFEQFEVEVTGQLDYRGTLAVADDAIVYPTNLAYTLRFSGDVLDADVAAIQADIARFCPVLLALTTPLAVEGRSERMS